MTEKDIPLYKQWATKEHVRSVWFCEGYQPVNAIYAKVAGNGYDYPYLILLDERPIGHIVTCDLFAYKTICPNPKGVFTDEPQGTYCIDLFIGEEELLNKGYGSKAVRQFTEFLFREKRAKRVLIDPDANNKQALRCYEKAGFTPIRSQNGGVVEVLILEKMAAPTCPQISIFIASSLDGYIADDEESVDFLYNIQVPEGEDCGFGTFMKQIDTIIMGRKTYEVTLSLTKGKWPHQGKRVIILSSTLEQVVPQAELYNGDLAHLMAKLHKEGSKHCWIDGGSVITAFLKYDLVHNFTLSIIPIILGSGVPLFRVVGKQIPLRLLASQGYPFGLVQLKYKISHTSV
jgi:dihydrofolate reductase/RimJ/RimL family protein N-acetyltransferase